MRVQVRKPAPFSFPLMYSFCPGASDRAGLAHPPVTSCEPAKEGTVSNARRFKKRDHRAATGVSGASDPVGGGARRRILWYSNAPWCATGYGTQTAQTITRLQAAGHEVAVHANYGLEGQGTTWRKTQIYPKGLSPYSDDVMVAHYQHWAHGNPHLQPLLMTLFDVWCLKSPTLETVPSIASWVPIDHTPTPPDVLAWCARPNVTAIAMSEFGQKMLHQAGVDALYVPHAVEPVFSPTPKVNGVSGREIMGVPDDAFVVMMNSANKGSQPPRKAFGENLLAFAIFAKTHSDAYLYLHTEQMGFNGVHLPTLVKACGIPADRVIFADQYAVRNGMPQEVLPALYTAADVLLAVSMGEGFGIPVVEAQACGTRAITSNQTAQTELNGHGWLVDCQPYWDTAQKSWFHMPFIQQIVSALEAAYEARVVLHEPSVEFASQYGADLVFDKYWKPVMAVLP